MTWRGLEEVGIREEPRRVDEVEFRVLLQVRQGCRKVKEFTTDVHSTVGRDVRSEIGQDYSSANDVSALAF